MGHAAAHGVIATCHFRTRTSAAGACHRGRLARATAAIADPDGRVGVRRVRLGAATHSFDPAIASQGVTRHRARRHGHDRARRPDRSGDWRHPFPEELDRRIVGRIADIHYAPSPEAAANLRARRNVVLTHGNTAKDAVRDVVGPATAASHDAAEEPYGLVLLHRYEFISNPGLVRETLRNLDRNSPLPLRIIVDSYSSAAIALVIEELGFERFTLMTKLEHSEFVAAMSGAEFIVTDSGGIQEEAAALGVPTLIHRKATERYDGLGTTAVLSGWDQPTLTRFLSAYQDYRRGEPGKDESPSDIIVADLVARGFAVPADSAPHVDLHS